eukprot:366341-Chlamydomonas_euryale.AAC.19
MHARARHAWCDSSIYAPHAHNAVRHAFWRTCSAGTVHFHMHGMPSPRPGSNADHARQFCLVHNFAAYMPVVCCRRAHDMLCACT